MGAKRVTLVADELLGYVRTGGIGTATSFLALALARSGHEVDVLYAGPDGPASGPGEWARAYEDAGVSIRELGRSREAVEPPYFAQMRDVEVALAASAPDVVVAQDLAAPVYTALRARSLGLGFESTVFVVYCHGTRRWITDTARKVRVLPNAHAITVLEQASVELADAVVAPSRYVVEWMRGQGWRLPQTFVVPYFSRSAATGEERPRPAPVATVGIRRISFFGRLEERKGLAPFLAALNGLGASSLRGLELEFLGRATRAWTPERIEATLSGDVRGALAAISFRTDLDQHEALARLSEPGTLAVLPSFGETFGNAVRECLDHGTPFLASDAGAVPELISADDRERVLFRPTAAGIEGALRRALASPDALVPARSAFDDEASASGWRRVLELRRQARPARDEGQAIDVVVLHRGSRDALDTCLSALARQTYRGFTAIVVTASATGDTVSSQTLPLPALVIVAADASPAAMRETGLRAGSSPWLVFLESADVPEPELLETLARAQAALGADVVSCAVTVSEPGRPPVQHYFAGEPRGLGAIGNGYGTVALLRRSLLDANGTSPVEHDDLDWPLLATLSVAGARVVSVPVPLVTRRRAPGDAASDEAAALLVASAFESGLPEALRSLARVAAGLAAEAARTRDAAVPPRLLGRVRRRFGSARS